jgi:hypothetical protein
MIVDRETSRLKRRLASISRLLNEPRQNGVRIDIGDRFFARPSIDCCHKQAWLCNDDADQSVVRWQWLAASCEEMRQQKKKKKPKDAAKNKTQTDAQSTIAIDFCCSNRFNH